MKKLALIILAALMTTSSHASASPPVDCDFVKSQALKGVDAYKDLTGRLTDDRYDSDAHKMFGEWRTMWVNDTNMLTNVYNTFCK